MADLLTLCFFCFCFYCFAFLENSNSVYFFTAKISSLEKYFKSTGNLLVQKTLSPLKKETILSLIQLKKKAAFGSRKPNYWYSLKMILNLFLMQLSRRRAVLKHSGKLLYRFTPLKVNWQIFCLKMTLL